IQGKLRGCRLEKARRNFYQLKDEVKELEEKKKQANKKYSEAREKRDEVAGEEEKVRTKLNSIDAARQEVDSFRQPVLRRERKLSEEIGRVEVRCESVQEQLFREKKTINNSLKKREEELIQLADNYNQLYISRLQKKIKETQAEYIQNLEDRLKEERRNLNNRLEEIRDRSLFQISEESEFRHWQQNLQEEASQLEEQKEDLEKKIERAQGRVVDNRKLLAQAHEKYIDVNAHLQQLRLQVKRLRDRQKCVKSIFDQLRNQMEEERQQLEAMRSRRQTLNQMYNRYEGFYRGVKSLMQAVEKGEFSSVVGVVANLITVPRQFSRALQKALGREMQYVITENKNDTRQMIEYLKKERAGRVTFLPLDELSVEPSQEFLELFAGRKDVHIASRVVDFPENIEPAVRYLLGRVLVVEDLEKAYSLRENEVLPEGTVIVTREGEKLSPGGSITGGVGEEDREGLLTRGERLEQMEKKIEKKQSLVNIYEKRHNWSNKQLEELEEQEKQVMNALQGVQAEVRESYEQTNNYRHSYEKSLEESKNLTVRLAEIIEKQLVNQIQRRGTEEIASTIASREARRRENSKDYRRKLEDTEGKLEEIQKQWRRLESRVQSEGSRQRELKGQVKQARKRRKTLFEQICQSRQELNRLRQQLLEKEKERTGKELNRTFTTIEQKTWDDIYSRLTEIRTECEKNSRQISSRLQKCERNTEKARSRLERLENELSNRKARLEEQIELLREDLEVNPGEESLEELQTGPAADYSSEQLNSRIEKLKGELRDLRPVNMLADREAEKLEKEVTKIAEQKEDLEQSCEKLEKVIRRLNDRARQQFKEAFAEIQEYFQEMVKELFGGGGGQLSLTEGSVLEAGVTLEIEPPGEKLKTMSALSGGEKSLAALALLFALYERKSTPFCFLDEVDAPLDDDNVSQFINLLHRYSDETQFVVITHDKLTMQAASQLYGVTMEESGVTTMVRIDLEKADNYHEKEQVG
ncbi:MAG: hypothetical protein ACQEP7_05475, partial [bacterium]